MLTLFLYHMQHNHFFYNKANKMMLVIAFGWQHTHPNPFTIIWGLFSVRIHLGQALFQCQPFKFSSSVFYHKIYIALVIKQNPSPAYHFKKVALLRINFLAAKFCALGAITCVALQLLVSFKNVHSPNHLAFHECCGPLSFLHSHFGHY